MDDGQVRVACTEVRGLPDADSPCGRLSPMTENPMAINIDS